MNVLRYYSLITLLLMANQQGFAMDVKEELVPSKSQKIKRWLANKIFWKSDAPVANHLSLPYDIWLTIGDELLDVGDYLHLASTCKETYFALANSTRIATFAQSMRPFRFPIFEDNEKPYRMLRNVHYFRVAAQSIVPGYSLRIYSFCNSDLVINNVIQRKGFSWQSYALCEDGCMYSWGVDIQGELGIGRRNRYVDTPTAVSGLLKDKRVIAIEKADNSVAVLTSEGMIYVWGKRMAFVNPGDGPEDQTPFGSISSPLLVKGRLLGKRIIALRAGCDHFLLLTESGAVYSWGDVQSAALGRGGVTERPQRVAGAWAQNRVIEVHAGDRQSFALTADGGVYAWGDNSTHMLGFKRARAFTTPKLLNKFGNSRVKTIKKGSGYYLALTKEGKVFGWGCNTHGQLGLGHNNLVPSPEAITSKSFCQKVIALEIDQDMNIATCEDGEKYRWGRWIETLTFTCTKEPELMAEE